MPYISSFIKSFEPVLLSPLFLMVPSIFINNEGSNIVFVNIAVIRVIDDNKPNATVPPKLEKVKIKKPQKSIIEL